MRKICWYFYFFSYIFECHLFMHSWFRVYFCLKIKLFCSQNYAAGTQEVKIMLACLTCDIFGRKIINGKMKLLFLEFCLTKQYLLHHEFLLYRQIWCRFSYNHSHAKSLFLCFYYGGFDIETVFQWENCVS